MVSSSFPVPVESVPVLDDCLTVAAAASQLSRAGGKPAIVLDRAMRPLGLLFPHRLLDPDLPPGCQLGSRLTTLLEVVPLIRSTVTVEMLQDCAQALRQSRARYAIAVGDGDRAIGVIDLAVLPGLEPVDRDLAVVVERFAHEIASPLMGVLSLATLLGDTRLASLSEPQTKQVQAIGHSAARIAYELERLDLVSRIQMDKTILYAELTTLTSLVLRAIAQARDRCQRSHPDAEEHGLELQTAAISVAMDRRYGLHVLAAAIECVMGRYESSKNLHLAAQAIAGDLAVSLESVNPGGGVGVKLTPRSILEMMPADRSEALVFLRTLVHFLKGDVSLKPNPDTGFRLMLLLPGVVVSETNLDHLEEVEKVKNVEEFGASDLVESSGGDIAKGDQSSPQTASTGAIAPGQDDDIPADRAILLTQHLTGHDLAHFEQSGWYVAIALSINELLAKVDRLAPRFVILDCAAYNEDHSITHHLIRDLDRQAIAIATLHRDRPELANPTNPPSDPSSQRNSETFTLHYPLQSSEVSACFEWAQVMRSTIVLIDLCDPLLLPPHTTQPTIQGSSIAHQLRRHHCRTIEVNDLERAQLFAEIWQPQAIVLQFVPESAVADWPQRIEHLAERVGIPCLIFNCGDWAGQACRLDRSIVYWPASSPSDAMDQPDVIQALQWLQHHHRLTHTTE